MSKLSRLGSILFAIPLGLFGIQYLCYGRFVVRGLPPYRRHYQAFRSWPIPLVWCWSCQPPGFYSLRPPGSRLKS